MAPLRSLLFYVCLCLSGCGVPKREQWTERVTLHDAREVVVSRATWNQWEMNGADGMAWRRKYSIKVPNPNTGNVVRWSGRWSEKPIIVEFDRRYAYVVFVPELCNLDMKRYGNPNPPHVVLRRANGWFQSWRQVGLSDCPAPLRTINLTLHSMWGNSGQGQRRFSAEEVKALSRPSQLMDAGFTQSPIPHDWESWKYQYKHRDGYGCAGEFGK